MVTRGWNGYRNKSQHIKLTLEKKILLPLLQGFEPATFQSWVWHSNHWTIPAPMLIYFIQTKKRLIYFYSDKKEVDFFYSDKKDCVTTEHSVKFVKTHTASFAGRSEGSSNSSSSLKSPSSGLRLGLSRHAHIKPLHPSLKVSWTTTHAPQAWTVMIFTSWKTETQGARTLSPGHEDMQQRLKLPKKQRLKLPKTCNTNTHTPILPPPS